MYRGARFTSTPPQRLKSPPEKRGLLVFRGAVFAYGRLLSKGLSLAASSDYPAVSNQTSGLPFDEGNRGEAVRFPQEITPVCYPDLPAHIQLDREGMPSALGRYPTDRYERLFAATERDESDGFVHNMFLVRHARSPNAIALCPVCLRH